jgi:hypothetical protein
LGRLAENFPPAKNFRKKSHEKFLRKKFTKNPQQKKSKKFSGRTKPAFPMIQDYQGLLNQKMVPVPAAKKN